MFNKTIKEYILILIIAVVILIICYSISTESPDNQQKESMINIDYEKTYWNRNNCPYIMSQTLVDELEKSNIQRSDNDWGLYFPCAYDDIRKEVNEMPVVNNAKYFILENCDTIVAKEGLWKHVVDHHGHDKAKTMMPNSYVLYDNVDLQKFNNEYDPNKIYIMKKNIQRQEGLKITKNKNDIMKGASSGYVIVQELLQDPYCISGRKTNMRFYILVVCKGGKIEVHVYKDGFMYYTRKPFQINCTDDDPNITTGYIDRQVYVDNPLTHQDFKTYLDNPNRQNLSIIEQNIRNQNMKISEVCFYKIYNLIREIFMSFVNKLCGEKASKKFNDTNITFQIFGADIAVNTSINSVIIECNKGPDLSSKDDRDSTLKHNMVRDALKIVGVIPSGAIANDNGFIKVLDVSNGSIRSSSCLQIV